MKIIYLGNFDNPYSDTTEKHIKYSFEKLGHKVIPINERDFYQERNQILEKIHYEDIDLFFFHKAGLDMFGIPPEDIVELLTCITCQKVFWFFDNVEVNDPKRKREKWMELVIPFVDYGFLTDVTWIRRYKYPNLFPLRMGIGDENLSLGKYQKEYDIPIAFLGAIYGERRNLVTALKKEFGNEKFRVFNNIFGQDLKDFCASCKILIAPSYPGDDFYWSSRIYQIIGNGGFLIHPKFEGLKDEGWIEGKHYVGYKNYPEMVEKIKYYLEHEDERQKIQKTGYKFCIQNFTFTQRIEEMLKICQKHTT